MHANKSHPGQLCTFLVRPPHGKAVNNPATGPLVWLFSWMSVVRMVNAVKKSLCKISTSSLEQSHPIWGSNTVLRLIFLGWSYMRKIQWPQIYALVYGRESATIFIQLLKQGQTSNMHRMHNTVNQYHFGSTGRQLKVQAVSTPRVCQGCELASSETTSLTR